MPRLRLGFAVILAFVSTGCDSGGGGSPTGSTTPESAGSVVPVHQEAIFGAYSNAPGKETVVDLATIGPDSTGFGSWSEVRSAQNSGGDEIGGSGSSLATISLGAVFTSTDAGQVSGWSLTGSGSASATTVAGSASTEAIEAFVESGYTFDFRVDEPGLVLAVEVRYLLTGSSAVLDVFLDERSPDGLESRTVFEFDVESSSEEPVEYSETIALREGYLYQFDADTLVSAFAGGDAANQPVEVRESTMELSLVFAVQKAPES